MFGVFFFAVPVSNEVSNYMSVVGSHVKYSHFKIVKESLKLLYHDNSSGYSDVWL